MNNVGYAYGKLYIAGEYAILTDKSKALLFGVPLDIRVEVTVNDKAILPNFNNLVECDTIYSDLYNKKSKYQNNHKFNELFNFLKFFKATYQINKPLDIQINSHLHNKGNKYGLGSSAAVLVAMTKALNNYFNLKLDDYKIFKVVVIFSLLVNKQGSFGDVAGCMKQGFCLYEKFNIDKIKLLLNDKKSTISPYISKKDKVKTKTINKIKEKKISDFFKLITYIDQFEAAKKYKKIIDSNWENLKIEYINSKIHIKMIAKWTKKYVDTNIHINLFREIEKNENKKDIFNNFIKNSNDIVENLIISLKNNDENLFIKNINLTRKNLLNLEQTFGIQMETEYMKKWIDNIKCGKQSGSGSGDMMLGFIKTDKDFNFTIELE